MVRTFNALELSGKAASSSKPSLSVWVFLYYGNLTTLWCTILALAFQNIKQILCSHSQRPRYTLHELFCYIDSTLVGNEAIVLSVEGYMGKSD